VEKWYHTTRGGWWVRATDEECASNAGEHGRPDKSTQKVGALHVDKTNLTRNTNRNYTVTAGHIALLWRSALPEDLNSMAAGGEGNGNKIHENLHYQHDPKSREEIHIGW
jgi:hypothetical protein